MTASKTLGTADHLNTITELLDTLRSASELVGWAARRLQDAGQHPTAGRLHRAQDAYDRVIVKTIGVYGDAAPAVGRGCIPDTEAVREAAPDLLEALQAVSLTVAIHAGQNPGDREAQQDLAKVRAALRKATTVRRPEVAQLVPVPADEPLFFQQFNYVADGVAKTRDGISVVSIGPSGTNEHILVSANALVSLLLVSSEVKRMMIPYQDGFGVDSGCLNRALAAADYAFRNTNAVNGGVEAVEKLLRGAVDTINATVNTHNESNVSRVAPSDAAIKPSTDDPAHGGPGGTMGDAAAAMPVPGCTVGNEFHSRPLTRGEAAASGDAA